MPKSSKIKHPRPAIGKFVSEKIIHNHGQLVKRPKSAIRGQSGNRTPFFRANRKISVAPAAFLP
jgi:hypothetical protein